VGSDKRRDGEVHRGKNGIINLCKILSICIPSQLKGKIKRKEVAEEIRLVLERYQISEEELYSGSLVFGLVLSITTFLCILFAEGSYLLAITFLVSSFMILSNLPIIILLGEARQLRATYLSYADIILETFLFSKIATGDIYDALVSVANLEEEAISHHFKKVLKKVLLEGISAEKVLMNSARGNPFETLKAYILVMFKLNSSSKVWRQAIKEARREIRDEYQKYTLELESRMMMMAGVSMFLPLLLTMWLIAPNSDGLLYMILPIQSSSAAFLSRLLLSSKQKIL